MTFKKWLTQYCRDQGIKESFPAFDKVDMLDCWNAAQEEARKEHNALLKELYPLRVYEVNTCQTNKEQTNEDH